MPLEVLYFPFVLLGLRERAKSAEVATLSRVWILFSRIQAELPGFEFTNHIRHPMRPAVAASPVPHLRFFANRNFRLSLKDLSCAE